MTDRLRLKLSQLRQLSDQIRSVINRVSMEQKARYKELFGMLHQLERQSEAADVRPGDASETEFLQRAAGLQRDLQRFQEHLEPHDEYVAVRVA